MQPNTKPCPECGEPINIEDDICEDCALADEIADEDEEDYEGDNE